MAFDPAQEDADGKGWIVTSGDDTLEPPSYATNTYLTYTAAAAAQKALFQADPTVDAYLTAKAEAQVLAAQSAAVATAEASLRTAEGL
jgi:hypothetical protein